MAQKDSYNKKTILLINLILFEVFLMIFSNALVFLHMDNLLGLSISLISRIILIAGVIVAVLSLFLLQEIMRLAEKENEAKVNEVLLKEGKETIDLLRTHRHDFVNHLQVIYGMLQLNKSDNALDYVEEVIGDMETETRMSSIDNPVLAALFIKKSSQAEKSGVKLDIRMESQLKDIPVNSADLSRIVSNLLDNAIYAAGKEPGVMGQVQLKLAENEKFYEITVINNGATIPENIRGYIFEKGFTTKEDEGHGFGLYIVKNLVEKNSGTIHLDCDEEKGTRFTVFIPKI